MAHDYVIGIDEVGRGSLAGPLCVGACLVLRKKTKILGKTLLGVKDSKKLTPLAREEWFAVIERATKAGECAWCTVFVGEKIIDAKGLSFALRKAIAHVLKKLRANPLASLILLDGGIKAPRNFLFQQTIVKGDEKIPLIAGASIMAKVSRDRYMVRLSRRFPKYGFHLHKGYGTEKHYEALRKYGVSSVHRKSFLRKFQNPSTPPERRFSRAGK